MSPRPALAVLALSLGCAATTPATPASAPTPTVARPTAAVAIPFLDAPLAELDPDPDPTETPEAIATTAAIALVSTLEGGGDLHTAYADTLECFHGDGEITLAEVHRRLAEPFPSAPPLSWSTIASIDPIAATDSAVALLVRGSVAIEGDLADTLDERLVIVRALGESWKIVAELDRESECFAGLWEEAPVDPFFVTCANIGRMCAAAIDEESACGGVGCACNSCLMQHESCGEKALSCLADTLG